MKRTKAGLNKSVISLGAALFFCLGGLCFAEEEVIIKSATASSQFSPVFRAARAIDNNFSSSWRGKANQAFWWLKLDLAGPYSLGRVSIWWDKNYGSTRYSIQASPDNKNWINLHSNLSSIGGKTNPRKVDYSLSGQYRYIRLYINRPQKNYPVIYEVKLYKTQPVLSISVDPRTWNINQELKVNNTVTMNREERISVTNDGNVTETFILSLIDPPGWRAAADPGDGTYVLSGLFCDINDIPQSASFNQVKDDDVILTQAMAATPVMFGYAQAAAGGVSVPVGQARSLYLQFKSPTITDKQNEQEISVIVSCQTP
ncbi:MAG: discoidin domain-containing protein [Candidatus Omnitrophica bacterium]|nr:discoidin domain-containing protein [Candidatus Omnitrophota bacterium]